MNDKPTTGVNLRFWHLTKDTESNELEIGHYVPLILTRINSCFTISLLALVFGIFTKNLKYHLRHLDTV